MVLVRDLAIVDPHAELAPAANFERGIKAAVLLDERRHTGGARQVVSRLAIADANVVHRPSPFVAKARSTARTPSN